MAELRLDIRPERWHVQQLSIHSKMFHLESQLGLHNDEFGRTSRYTPLPYSPNSKIGLTLLQSKELNTKDSNRQVSDTGNNNDKNGGSQKKHINKDKLTRKANLGSTIEMLQIRVPLLLQELLPETNVCKNIIFRILPHKYPNMPQLKGYLLYSTTLKTLQLALTSFYLNPKTQIHITNIKVEEPTSSMSSDELVKLSLKNTEIESVGPSPESKQSAQSLSNFTTKIIIKWRTCLNGCPHLEHTSTAHAKMGSFKFDNLDMSKVLPESGKNLSSALIREIELKLFPGFFERKNKSSQFNDSRVSKGGREIERIVSGVFIFELTADNSSIAVFTIDNCDVLENKEPDIERFGLAPQA